jgi:hypothetical protein
MESRYVIVHLSLGFDRGGSSEPARKVLDFIKDKDPSDIILLSDGLEFKDREKYSRLWGVPVDRFHYSYDGHLSFNDGFNVCSFFKGKRVEVMGYQYSPSGRNCCINNAASDLGYLTDHVEIPLDRVLVVKP